MVTDLGVKGTMARLCGTKIIVLSKAQVTS